MKFRWIKRFQVLWCKLTKNGENYISCNKTNGRLDTNFTRLTSEVITSLRIDGDPLIEIDIVNSQAFIATGLFHTSPQIEKIMVEQLGKKTTHNIKGLHLQDCDDAKLYSLLVSNGWFYEYMMDQFDSNNINYIDRKDIKEQLFTVFFGKNNSYTYSPAVRLFDSKFPSIHKAFWMIKELRHNKLAILLQRIESYTMLICICNRIIDDLPNLPFITRHDSILPKAVFKNDKVSITAEDKKVADYMLDGIDEIVGVKPLLKIKPPFQEPFTYPKTEKYSLTAVNIYLTSLLTTSSSLSISPTPISIHYVSE